MATAIGNKLTQIGQLWDDMPHSQFWLLLSGAAVAMAMGHVILKEFYFDKRSAYFDDYARRYTDLPLLVMLKEHTLPDGRKTLVPDRYLRASDFNGKLGQQNNPEWKTVAFDTGGRAVLPNGSIGFRWTPEGGPDQGKWNLENKEARGDSDVTLRLSLLEAKEPQHEIAEVGFRHAMKEIEQWDRSKTAS